MNPVKQQHKLSILRRQEEGKLTNHHKIDSKTDRHLDLGNKIFWSRKTRKEKGVGKLQFKDMRGPTKQLIQINKNSHSLQIDAHSIHTPNDNRNHQTNPPNMLIFVGYKFPFKALKSQQNGSENSQYLSQQKTATKFPNLSYKKIEHNPVSQNIKLAKSVKLKHTNQSCRQSEMMRESRFISNEQTNQEAKSMKKFSQINICLNVEEIVQKRIKNYFSADRPFKFREEQSVRSLEMKKYYSGKKVRKDETSRMKALLKKDQSIRTREETLMDLKQSQQLHFSRRTRNLFHGKQGNRVRAYRTEQQKQRQRMDQCRED